MQKMKKLNDIKDIESLVAGELYLFSAIGEQLRKQNKLLGVLSDVVDGTIYLESSTHDYCNYSLWHPLPEGYSYFRIATRSELRDYMYGLGRWELNIKLG